MIDPKPNSDCGAAVPGRSSTARGAGGEPRAEIGGPGEFQEGGGVAAVAPATTRLPPREKRGAVAPRGGSGFGGILCDQGLDTDLKTIEVEGGLCAPAPCFGSPPRAIAWFGV